MPRLIACVASVCLSWCGVTRSIPASCATDVSDALFADPAAALDEQPRLS